MPVDDRTIGLLFGEPQKEVVEEVKDIIKEYDKAEKEIKQEKVDKLVAKYKEAYSITSKHCQQTDCDNCKYRDKKAIIPWLTCKTYCFAEKLIELGVEVPNE